MRACAPCHTHTRQHRRMRTVARMRADRFMRRKPAYVCGGKVMRWHHGKRVTAQLQQAGGWPPSPWRAPFSQRTHLLHKRLDVADQLLPVCSRGGSSVVCGHVRLVILHRACAEHNNNDTPVGAKDEPAPDEPARHADADELRYVADDGDAVLQVVSTGWHTRSSTLRQTSNGQADGAVSWPPPRQA